MPLPFLRSVEARAAEPTHTPFVLMRCANGVVQADVSEPERFWPANTGDLTRERLENTPRVVGELANYAERMLLVRGTQFPFPPTLELHASGGNMLLTAMPPGPSTAAYMTLAQGESLDNWMARQHELFGGEPLTLFAGGARNLGNEVLSYRGPNSLRAAEHDPYKAYLRLIGANHRPLPAESIHDLVREQLDQLVRNPRLSTEDKSKLELHLDSVRDLELMGCRLTAEREAAMAEVSGQEHDDLFRMEVSRLHCDLLALVLGCDHAAVATIQIGDRADQCAYEINGHTLPNYHQASHRIPDERTLPAEFPTNFAVHEAINRLHMQLFGYLIDRLDEHGVTQRGVAVWTSDVATGSHRFTDLPWIVVGPGDGSLHQGRFLHAGGVSHNKMLNTLATASGYRTADGGPIVDFGDDRLEPGLIDGMMR